MGWLSNLFHPSGSSLVRSIFDPAGAIISTATGQPNNLRSAFDPAGILLHGSRSTGVNPQNPNAPTALPPILSAPMGHYSQMAYQLAGSPALGMQGGGVLAPQTPQASPPPLLPGRDPYNILGRIRLPTTPSGRRAY